MSRRRRILRRIIVVVAILGFAELFIGHYIARPLGLIHRSTTPDMVYENVPGIYLGHQTYDVWKAPMYMVLDLLRTESTTPPTSAPPGYTLYRIDGDGCRAPSAGPVASQADVLFMGSSQAFGMLVSAEESVPGVLEQSLHERGFGPDVHVTNCAVIGHRLVQTLLTTQRAQKLKKSKLVVTLVRPWHMTEQFDYIDVLAPANKALRWAIDHSNLARFFYYIGRTNSKPMARLPRSVIETRVDDYVREMNAVGVRSLFILLDNKNEDCSIFDELSDILLKRGLGVERIDTPSGPKDMFLDRDRHWSVKGSAFTASQILDATTRELEAVGVPRTGGSTPPPAPTP